MELALNSTRIDNSELSEAVGFGSGEGKSMVFTVPNGTAVELR